MVKIVLIQKQTGHEPDTWEDIKIPKATDGEVIGIGFVAEKFRQLQVEGAHRIFLADGTIHNVRAYPVTEWQVAIDGKQCE